MKAKVLITGATGLIGQRLSQILRDEDYQVAYLSRTKSIIPKIPVYKWDIKQQEMEPEALKKADHIIHLAGAGVADKKWTEERKNEILKSRTRSTQLLFNALAEKGYQPKSFVSASAIGIYGTDTGDTLLTEESPKGDDFLAEVTKKWEEAVQGIASLGIRTVKLRIGIVLSDQGGALPKIAQPIRFGVGAPIGSGKQYLSWIHIDDLCRMFMAGLENEQMEGVYNAVGPAPVTNEQLTKATASVLRKPLILPKVPAFTLKMTMGEMASIVLGGNKVSNEKIVQTGFTYQFPELKPALENLLKK
ncbi:MAG: TIGR01777 family oxidoreductase [Thermonemataceae bacterium]